MDHKICRVCGENSGNLNIFDPDGNGIDLSSRIMYCCTKIEINKNDGLPSYICSYCAEDLTIAYRFVSKCEATDRTLRAQSSKLYSNICSRLATKIEVKSEETDLELNISDNEPSHYISHEQIESPLTALCQKLEIETDHSALKCSKLSIKTAKRPKKYINSTVPRNCLICGRECANPSTLATHMRSHTNEKPYQCEFCNNKYKDPNTLKRHCERNHLKVRERNFICENCGKGFFSTSEIITHLRTHTGETPYACSECSSSFTQLSSLIRHKKKHRGEKSEICDVCTKRFCTKDQLKRHQQVHTSNKDFSCHICHSVFKYKHNLTKHHKLHSEPNSYVCNHCGRTFNAKGNLKIHIKRVHSEKSGYCKTCSKIVSNIEVHTWKHTGERPLKCEICSKSFYEAKALSHHYEFSS